MEAKKMKCAVLGGDIRQIRLCRLLAEEGWQVEAFGLGREELGPGVVHCDSLGEALRGACWAALPMPAQKEGRLNAPLAEEDIWLEPMLDSVVEEAPACLLLAGLPDPALCRMAAERGLKLRDYGAEEALTRRNAAITAEAALGLALKKREQTILGANCLVVGYGRIGQALAWRLRALGAKVAVSARKPEDLELARCAGLEAIETEHIGQILPRQELVYNTVPSLVLDREKLALLSPHTLTIDLASKPGGAGFLQRRKRSYLVFVWRFCFHKSWRPWLWRRGCLIGYRGNNGIVSPCPG